MATARPLSPPANEQRNEQRNEQDIGTGNGVAEGTAAEQSLVPFAQQSPQGPQSGISARVARLPVELDVSVPVRNFRVRDLLALEPTHLIESDWGHGDDVPLASGHVQLAWSEFEVIDRQLAVRVTRLA
jgi:flagellar motor switch/type III secretory pathway protein FliN